jgi:lysophospholipase L1-like esterase
VQQLIPPVGPGAASRPAETASEEHHEAPAAAPPTVAVHGEIAASPRTALASRPVLALVTLLALAAIAEAIPALERLRVFREPAAKGSPAPPPAAGVSAEPALGEARIETESRSRPDLAQPEHAELPVPARGPIAGSAQNAAREVKLDFTRPPLPIADPSGKALDGFYAALERTRQKQPGAVTRVVHFGDSIVTSDYVSGTLRRKLQDQFGDAGHGFSLIANAWPAYFHNDVYRFASSGWLVSRIVGPLSPDGLYGLGGVSFRAPPGARARFGTARSGRYGRAVSRFVVVFLKQPGGGQLALNVDSEPHSMIDTEASEVSVARHEVTVTDGEHELEIVTKKGMTRAFGVIMERVGPGVVLDAIGIQGARIRFLDKQDDRHWADELVARKPDLLIYQFGANESGDNFAYPMAEYRKTMLDVLRQGRTAVPDAGCLVIAAMDRAEKRGTALTSMPVIPALVKEQKAAATEIGCALFDTYTAMGGAGSMPTWVRRGLGQADLTHPSGVGSEVLATWIYRALMQGYDEYLKRGKR